MIRLVISGGQTGADMGGLMAAKECQIKTGGYCPKGYRTELGPVPILADYGLTETDTSSFAARTVLNIRGANATVLIASKPNSSGSRLTVAACARHGKPCIWLHPDNKDAVAQLVDFFKAYQPEIINVAGNRESVSPGICVKTRLILAHALTEYNRLSQTGGF